MAKTSLSGSEGHPKEFGLTLVEAITILKALSFGCRKGPTFARPGFRSYLAPVANRAYFTSMKTDDAKVADVTERLWKLEFSPQVFNFVFLAELSFLTVIA